MKVTKIEIPQSHSLRFEVGEINVDYGKCTAIKGEFLPTKQGLVNNEWNDVETSLFYIVTLIDAKDGTERKIFINGNFTDLVVTYK